jgi:hypothetical protein
MNGVNFAVEIGARPKMQQHRREDDAFESDVRADQNNDAQRQPIIMHDQRHQAEQYALQRQKSDTGADPARAEQRKARKQANRVDRGEERRHRDYASSTIKATAESVAAPTMNCGTVAMR